MLDAHLSEYRAQALAHSAPARGTDAWVKWVNSAADRLREIAILEAAGDPTASRFAVLLADDSASVRTWAAHHVLELFHNRSPELEQLALKAIEAAALGDTANALGERMWLEEWRSTHPVG